MITLQENELYQEIEIFVDGEKIGEAEIEIKGEMISRLSIFPPYQDKVYVTEIVNMINEKYGCDVLCVNDDNKREIRTYEKNGYTIDQRCEEYYNKALDDFKKHLLDICNDYNSVYDSQIICIAEQLKSVK